MAIKDEMYKMIVQEIDESIRQDRFNPNVDQTKTKAVAKMLTDLSVDPREADSLVNQYMANIKNICK